MTEEKSSLEVTIRFRDTETRFVGKPDDVIQSVLKYFYKILPGYELISNLTLTVDMEDLLRNIKGLIVFTPEGIVVTIPREKIGGERDIILVHLVKSYIGFKTGRTGKDSLTMNEIQSFTGGKFGTVGARLSELTSLGWVERVGRGEYRITTLGVKAFMDEILPKLKPKEESKS
ncbi:hypothetical protein KEJ18_07455 [Candidatus Bathyarchaeota archaeon]|nr:hypothetical protein [Candidatus Bathyarchaeota archaeon]